MALQRQVKIDGIFDGKKYNVFDVDTREIVFTGGMSALVNFFKLKSSSHFYYYIKNKRRYKNKYAIRIASDKKKPG